MPTSPLEISHKTLFKSTIRPTPRDAHSTPVPPDPSGAWPSSQLSSDHLEPHEWTYLAEGGKSLLVRFDGDVENARGGWVNDNASKALALRLPKKARGGGGGESHTQSPDAAADASASIDRDVFEQRVAGPLLQSKSLIPPSRKIALPANNPNNSAGFLQKLAARIEMQRPRERRAVDGVDVDAPHIEIVEDLSWASSVGGADGTAILGVEIKPKWLFGGSDGVSRYRKHAVLRNQDLSRDGFDALYEPLDLISGDASRVDKATRGLIANWQTGGNNLRLFAGGKVVEAGNADAASTSTPLMKQLQAQTKTASLTDALAQILAPILASTQFQEVLKRLARLQSSLAPIDLESLAGWYSAQTRGDPSKPFARGEGVNGDDIAAPPTLDEFTSYAQDWLALQQQQDQGDAQVALTLRQALIGTLLSATFKDCSLFLRVTVGAQQGGGGNDTSTSSTSSAAVVQAETATSAVEGATTGSYLSENAAGAGNATSIAADTSVSPTGYTLKIIDVDTKPIDKLAHWLTLERDIEKAYRDWLKA